MNTPRSLSRGERAFTLMEAVLVAAIIAVLALLSFGAAGRLGERGHTLKCISYLRQNAALIHATLQDHRGFLPYYDKQLKGYTGLWWYKMYKTSGLKAEEFSRTMSCPINDQPRHLNLGGSLGYVTLGYRFNRRAGYHNGSAVVYPIVNLLLHPAPGKVPIMADGSNYPTDNALAFDEWAHVYAAHGGPSYGKALGNYGHALFLDGHVERIAKPAPGGTVPGDYDLLIRMR